MRLPASFAPPLLLGLLACGSWAVSPQAPAGEVTVDERASAPAVPATPAAAAATAPSPAPSAPVGDAGALTGRDRILADVARVGPLLRTAEARRFLERAGALPRIAPRTLHHDAEKKRWFTAAQAAALPAEERGALLAREVDEETYYTTRYGSPLSYARPLDLLFERGLRLPPGARVLDFGFGYVGHLRMLAAMGLDVAGVDVDPMLRALYAEPGDQGSFRGEGGQWGRVRLFHGRFPADAGIAQAIGSGYRLILSKNVLKKGYIHPDRPAEERLLIRLGAPDEAVLAAFFAALAPGGRMLVYNICPAPSPPDEPFLPWSDGRSPFTRAQWEAAGFRVLAFDEDDTPAIRALGHALGWDQGEGAMDLEDDLSVLYTLVERP